MLSNWLKADQYMKVIRFLGRDVVRLLVWGVLTGISLFFMELFFGYGIQLLFEKLGITSPENLRLPGWLLQFNLSGTLALLLTLSLFRGVLQWAQSYLQNSAYERFRENNRGRILSWLFANESASASRLLTLFGERVNSAAVMIMALQIAVIQATSCALLAITLFYIAPKLTLISFLSLAILALPVRVINRRIKEAGHGLTQEWDKVYRRLVMSIKNLLLLRIYGMEQEEERQIQTNLKAHLAHSLTQHRNTAIYSSAPQIFGMAIVCLISLLAAKDPNTNPGTLLTYFYLFIRFVQNISGLAVSLSSFTFFWPQILDLARWWAEHSHDGMRQPKSLSRSNAPTRPLQTLLGWEFKNLSFTYPGADAPVIRSLNLKIPAGSTLMITGPSGSGKSTLINLLLGELAPNAGEVAVLFNDRSSTIQQSKLEVLHNIGYVGPESFLFEGTIFQNLTYGFQGNVAPELLAEAIRQAECQFIHDLPNGLEHRLTDQGQGLSAGQKQRLSLARALLRKPKALILDEATANLDAATESRLIETFRDLKGKMTLIVVTHRESLLKLADHHFELT